MLLALFVELCTQVLAVSIQIDFTGLDIAQYRLHGPGVDQTVSNGEGEFFELESDSQYFIDLGTTGSEVALLRIELNEEGGLGEVDWKLDAQSSFEALPTEYSEISESGKSLRFYGVSILVDLRQTGHGLAHLPALKNMGLGEGENGIESGEYDLFPGRYRLELGQGLSGARFELGLNGELASQLDFRLEEGATWTELNPNCYSTTPTEVVLTGTPVSISLPAGMANEVNIPHLGLNKPLLAGETQVFDLLPGLHLVTIQDGKTGTEKADLLLEIDNEYLVLETRAQWKDLSGNRTNGGFAELDAGSVFLEKAGVIIGNEVPPPTMTLGPGPFATLHETLDGSYYPAYEGELWVKYDERYADNSNLDLKVFNLQNQQVSMPATSRTYGVNWLKLALDPSGFVQGSFYILEIRNAYGDLGTLKFQYK